MYKMLVIIISIIVGLAFSSIMSGLPDTKNIQELKLISATQVYDMNGDLIGKLFEQNRIVVTNSNMVSYLLDGVVVNEDSRFYSHMGVDPIGIARAIVVNLRNASIAEGGSTITQQLAREMFLTQEQTLTRKIREAILAIIIDFRFSKSEILQAYLNQVYLGEGAYGVEAAAQKYFNKHAKDLDLAESAMIVGLARGPALYSPYRDMTIAIKRRNTVLENMYAYGIISFQEKESAVAEPIRIVEKRDRIAQASYFMDYVANQLVEKYGADKVYQRGLKVYTTLDLKIQRSAENVLKNYQGGVIAIDPKYGHIKAMVGGNNYQDSQRNRVLEEYRQPGSAFKPFVYAAALNKGYRSNSVFKDEIINFAGYSPKNYDDKYLGAMTMHKALRWSVNTIAVKIGKEIGMDSVIDLAERAGISLLAKEDNHLATALGGLTKGVNLLELSNAYTIFANRGILSNPVAVLKVEDEHGNVLHEHQLKQKAVITEEVAYIMTDMLSGVIKDGTGTPAYIGREAAGKTGTTDGYETAWFIGYTPDLLVGIYVGNDDRSSIGLSGTQVASMWGKMMKDVVYGDNKTFIVPVNVINHIYINAKTGELAGKNSKDTEYSSFIKGTEPTNLKTKIKNKLLPKDAEGNEKKSEKNWWEKLPGLLGF